MKYPFRNSFQFRLLVSFLAVSLIPLCLCSALLMQVVRISMSKNQERIMEENTIGLIAALDHLSQGFEAAGQRLQNSSVLSASLLGGKSQDTLVYSTLYAAADEIRDNCVLHLYDLQGNARYSSQNLPGPQALDPNWGVLYASAQAEGKPVYAAVQESTDSSALLRAAVLLTDHGQPMGYLVMEFYAANFRQLLDGKYGSEGEIMLLNRFWRPVYSSQQSLISEWSPRLRGQLLSGAVPGENDPNYVFSIRKHEQTGLVLVLQQPRAFSSSTMKILYTVSLSWALVCVIISVLISIPLSRQISFPIRHLRQAFGKLEQDDLSVQVSTSRRDELGQLAQSFNHMVCALKTNREELVRNQKELNDARLRMLQAQLNPHFLCNTLDTMKWISKINKVPQVALMSTNLADILRFCISDAEFVPLGRELEILERYIEIQRIRLSDSFTFQTRIPGELACCPVPKMILQPIVENAIIHGLSGIENSAVCVEAVKTDDSHLRITVTDNGHGLPENMVGKAYSRQAAPEGGHLGLYNVDTILKIHYGENSGLFLDSGPGGVGTTVTTTLPIQKREDDIPC